MAGDSTSALKPPNKTTLPSLVMTIPWLNEDKEVSQSGPLEVLGDKVESSNVAKHHPPASSSKHQDKLAQLDKALAWPTMSGGKSMKTLPLQW